MQLVKRIFRPALPVNDVSTSYGADLPKFLQGSDRQPRRPVSPGMPTAWRAHCHHERSPQPAAACHATTCCCGAQGSSGRVQQGGARACRACRLTRRRGLPCPARGLQVRVRSSQSQVADVRAAVQAAAAAMPNWTLRAESEDHSSLQYLGEPAGAGPTPGAVLQGGGRRLSCHARPGQAGAARAGLASALTPPASAPAMQPSPHA